MKAAVLCQKIGWTWQEYREQPAHFIDIIFAMFEAEERENKNRQQ